MAESFWERVDRLRRVRRVSLKTLGQSVGRTESWASRAVRGTYGDGSDLSFGDLSTLAGLLGVAQTELLPTATNVRPLRTVATGQRMPIVNAVDAGGPHDHGYQAEEYVEVGSTLFGELPGGAAYLVVGGCLRDRLIEPGDYLIIDTHNTEPGDGEVVVARVNGVETAKLFYRVGEVVELRPASLGFETIIARPSDELEIVGVYVGLVRPPKRR